MPRDMFAEDQAAKSRSNEGWLGHCPCGLFVWYAWIASEHRAKHRQLDGVTPHVCEEPV